MRFYSYIQTSTEILNQYNGNVPFSIFIKQYFAANKKIGSNDRKQITALCYGYFRIYSAIHPNYKADTLKIASYLYALQPHQYEWYWKDLGILLQEDFSDRINELVEKNILQTALLFPFTEQLSTAIDVALFSNSHLYQPHLFLRIRDTKKIPQIEAALQSHQIPYQLNGQCLQLSNTTKVDQFLKIDEDVVVQDWASQQIQSLFLQIIAQKNNQKTFAIWDACAASGGKSLLAADSFPAIQLFASDIRKSILHNYHQRLGKARINILQAVAEDLSKRHPYPSENFDVIIADVPCTGSGTWGRTPEYLVFFDVKKIEEYTKHQEQIVNTILKQIKPQTYFIYITCSVFKAENEDRVEAILKQSALTCIQQQYFHGYTKGADTLFAALFLA